MLVSDTLDRPSLSHAAGAPLRCFCHLHEGTLDSRKGDHILSGTYLSVVFVSPPPYRMSPALPNVVRKYVAIAEVRDLHTERHDLGHSSPVGFVGQVTYVITRARSLNQADVWRLNALAQYAEFCGTGRKTAQGMGQTRRVARG